MHHLDIDDGYLVNFPHDDGFPVVEKSVFALQTLSGLEDASTLDPPVLRLRHHPNREESPSTVQMVQFKRLALDSNEGKAAMEAREKKRATPKWGITTTGLPCKICEQEQAYCRFHKHQEPSLNKTDVI